jgi:phosphonate transport system substrate-binding protein
LFSCQITQNDQTDSILVDFSVYDTLNQTSHSHDTIRKLSVAVSAIISPRETYIYYQELFNYISEKINYHIEVRQRKTYAEVNKMLYDQEVDLAFICSGAYTVAKEKGDIEILAVPVCNGKPFYQSYIITNKNSGIEKFEDFRGKSFAYTDPLSNSGKLYADKRLRDLNTTSDSFFASTMFTHAHDISIQLVSKTMIDGATVDGLIYEYLAAFYPDRVKNCRIVEKSEYFGIPPVIVPSGLNEGLKKQLRNVLLSLHTDSAGMIILDKLLIDKFIEGNDTNYNSIRQIQLLKSK